MEMLYSRVPSCGTFSRLQFGRERRAVSWYLFWVRSVNHHSHRLRLKQSQTKGKGWPPEGGGEGKVASGCRARCPHGVHQAGSGKGQSQEHRRGTTGLHQAPRHWRTDDPTLPTVKVNPPTRVPVEASHSRKAQGDHGHAGGPAAAGAWSSGLWLREAGGGIYGAREPGVGLAAETRAQDAAASPASALPRAAAPRLRPRPRPSARPASGSAPGAAPPLAPPLSLSRLHPHPLRALLRPRGGSSKNQLGEPSQQPGGLRGRRRCRSRGSLGDQFCHPERRSSPEDRGGKSPRFPTTPDLQSSSLVLLPGKGLLSGKGASPVAPDGGLHRAPRANPVWAEAKPGCSGERTMEWEVDVIGDVGEEAWRRLDSSPSPPFCFPLLPPPLLPPGLSRNV